MPKRNDIQKVMIIGSGPIVIGQACEFDYSGTQACKALRALGYKILLVNSNPATIMTDPGMADITYIEPLNLKTLAEIIEKERPDAILPNLGGQSGLNLTSELAKAGVLERFGVRVIGVNIDAIERGEDRIAFKDTMNRLGIEMPRSEPAYSVEEAEEIAGRIGYPVVIRPAYTMGGTGGGLVYNIEELRTIASRGLSASLVGQILIEESVLGWEELELEVVRDAKNNMITVCFIENIDPMGVHTGDSFCSAPMLTITPELQARLQKYSYDIVEAIEVIGGTNVQFAHDPVSDRVVVIEINPRTSRSSALASKATGFPIALISSKLAGGLTMDEIPYWRDGTLDKYTPSGDYVVIKFARWAFEKFKGVKDKLGTQMRSVGEVMSIGKTYKEAMLKSIRSLENGRYGLGFVKDFNTRSLDELMLLLAEPTSERQFVMYEALRKGASVEALASKTNIKAWFISQMRELVELEEQILSYKGKELPDELLVKAKKDGFADKYLSQLLGIPETEIRSRRKKLGVVHAWEGVRVSGVENAAYYYSTYNAPDSVPVSSRPKIMVLGGGPNRIGQGIEFDYCCVHAALAMREDGYETIMVNCNPETVSTDYDTSDRLYFEPLTLEDVLEIVDTEKPFGVIVQYGGQTPLKLALDLEAAGVPIIGTSPDMIDAAEDRERFQQLLQKLGLRQPPNATARTESEALEKATALGYPLVVRPSYVLGGRAMEIVHEQQGLERYMREAVKVSNDSPVLLDRFLSDAIECDVDAVRDSAGRVFIGGVMEHIEQAGVHSGDSACSLPPYYLKAETVAELKRQTAAMAQGLNVVGLMNVQFAIQEQPQEGGSKQDVIFVLEVNPRASRTVPFVSKATGIQLAKVAARCMVGDTLDKQGIGAEVTPPYFSVKEAVFPFVKFPGVDTILGPEMKSTGEVMGVGKSFGEAYIKAEIGAGERLPRPLKPDGTPAGKVFLTVKNHDKPQAVAIARDLVAMGFALVATRGTAAAIQAAGIACETVNKVTEGRPHVVDLIKNGGVSLVINTVEERRNAIADSRAIRTSALAARVPTITTIFGAEAAVEGMKAMDQLGVISVQEMHAQLDTP